MSTTVYSLTSCSRELDDLLEALGELRGRDLFDLCHSAPYLFSTLAAAKAAAEREREVKFNEMSDDEFEADPAVWESNPDNTETLSCDNTDITWMVTPVAVQD